MIEDSKTENASQCFLAIIKAQTTFFDSGKTKDVSERIEKLKALKKEIEKREKDIAKALYRDLKKPEFETFATETSIVLNELKLIIKKLKKWAKPKKIKSSWLNFPSSDYIYSQVYGKCLILAPWNYPFQLSLSPAIGALAAGNTVVVKPSEYSPNTSALIQEIFETVFPEELAKVVQGNAKVSQQLLVQKWDYVFFTGSVQVGKLVAKAIAPHPTPSTLELGGKSPCIIHSSAKIKLAAKRIVWGKFLNAGQTCIAPDYILIEASVKEAFIKAVKAEIQTAFGKKIQKSPDFAQIVNDKNFERLAEMLKDQKILLGGETDKETRFIAPTLIDEPDLNSAVMQEEIFGPILPLLSYTSEMEIEKIINLHPNPLSFYVFAEDKNFSEKILEKYSFGGGMGNDVVMHIANPRLPFGGIGNSGYGGYHGKFSFDTFTHQKSVSKRGTWIDLPFRYPPYKGKLSLLKKVMKKL